MLLVRMVRLLERGAGGRHFCGIGQRCRRRNTGNDLRQTGQVAGKRIGRAAGGCGCGGGGGRSAVRRRELSVVAGQRRSRNGTGAGPRRRVVEVDLRRRLHDQGFNEQPIRGGNVEFVTILFGNTPSTNKHWMHESMISTSELDRLDFL